VFGATTTVQHSRDGKAVINFCHSQHCVMNDEENDNDKRLDHGVDTVDNNDDDNVDDNDTEIPVTKEQHSVTRSR